ncbi:hypothetical protein QBC47DRAFT_409952 [Echria macrotheca]|uniref:Uncharacterized protein n=1 Tax=Echria macrotheca TaxID=438768 RepID=A0AAJ0BJ64_9PEZI|nr:hypothetical protein QBC47DRAFT_409952 [Echria macrotheca]
MPRKTRGIRKRYDVDLAGFDDDEPIQPPNDNSDDEDFGAPAEPAAVEDDEVEDDTISDDDGAEEGKDGGNSTEVQAKKARSSSAGMIQSRKGYHDLPSYPLETRIVTRVYAGPLRRYARYSALRDAMYGPDYHTIKIIWDLDNRWRGYQLLPPMHPPQDPQGIIPSPWLPPGFEATQERRTSQWYTQFQAEVPDARMSHMVMHDTFIEQHSLQAKDGLATLLGPWHKQHEFRLGPGQGIALSRKGTPLEASDNEQSDGWMLDIGGIPISIAWAPLSKSHAQVLAVASIPFWDQELAQPANGNPADTPEEPLTGYIQFWEFVGTKARNRLPVPSATLPRMVTAKFIGWGRPKRLQWCPVPIELPGMLGLLAVLCGDGKARVIEVRYSAETHSDGETEFIDSPVATLGLIDDYNVKVTCLTWVGANRIALGHSDGSITLWSLYPLRLLQRVGGHCNYLIDICSGYPSHPYLIASIPVGGCATLTDLSQPSSELTYFPVPAISFQPNLLCWNEIMQGFMALYPSSTPTTTVAFLHYRFFCQARSTITGPNAITCVSAGSTHPFILVGSADGSVYACNALQKLFRQKGETLQKLKIFEHEYRPISAGKRDAGETARGAVRILHGFLPEINDDPRTEKRKEIDRKKKLARKKAAGKKKNRSKKAGAADEDPEDREAELDGRLASRSISHEPLTRITNIAWNPNVQFSTWAACAMGSGLVKVMDLGVR